MTEMVGRRGKFVENYRGYDIIQTPDDFEVRNSDGAVVTWGYSLKGAKARIDDLRDEED